jgi:hypothetical protein
VRIEIAQFQQILWAVNSVVGLFLLVLLAVRKNYRAFPAFSFYVLVNLTLGALALLMYRRWGFSSPSSRQIGWGMQGAVICTRALAVAEVCRHLLARYRGIWAMAWRILLACAALVLVYSIVAARHLWELALLAGDRGMELSIAAVVVGVLLFTRYYDVQVSAADRALAVGFCLYSCFCVLNNTILEHYLHRYSELWNLLAMSAFLASLLLWTWALRKPQTKTGPEETLLSPGIYQTVAPQINLRLRSLNDQLDKIWKPEVTRQ